MLEIIFESFWFKIEIASIGLAIISYILIIVQSSINYMFKNYKTRSLVTERLLYEQFSYEVYENIHSYTYIHSDSSSSTQENYDYEYYYNYMSVELKLDSYYDCRDAYDPELNEEICQNQIVKNNTCCKSECCLKTNGDETFCYNYAFDLDNNAIKNNRILYYNDEEYFDDPKRRFCSNFSVYNKEKYIGIDYDLSGYLFKCHYDYIQIFLNLVPGMCIGKYSCINNPNLNKDCGFIDTMNNHLYVDDSSKCPIDDLYTYNEDSKIYASSNEYGFSTNRIIVRNILSEIEPDIHEWKERFISLENYENKETEEYKNLKEKFLSIRKKDIANIIKYNATLWFGRDFSLNEEGFSALNSKAKPKLYYTSYIGFDSEKDLTNFFKYFYYPDITNNPLYKIGKGVYPSLETIICGAVLCVLCIIYLIFFWRKSIQNYLCLLIVKECVLGVSFLIEFAIYIWQIIIFENIKIHMDYNYELILNLYNKRRIQYCLLFGLILLFISIIPFLIFLIIQKCKNIVNQQQEIPGNQERPQQNNINGNSPSQHQTIEGQATIEQQSPNLIRDSENQQLNDNIRENVREGNNLIIHNERNQAK